MTLAPYVQILGRGPGRARPLTEGEAEAAMTLILQGRAAPEAVGALLMLMRMQGETAAEIAGFVRAARDSLPVWNAAAPGLDWPSYAAGRTRGLPWFLLSARLVAQAGVPVLLHGWNGPQGGAVRAALPGLGIKVAGSVAEAGAMLARDRIVYLPLEVMSAPLFGLVSLRAVLGLRSCINTVLRMLNPGGATAAVQGVFHPSYRDLQADAGALLGQPELTVLKGGGGEFERHPCKEIALFGLRDGQPWTGGAALLLDQTRRLAEGPADPTAIAAVWDGGLVDDFADAVLIGTAAIALETAGVTKDGLALARALWSDRHRSHAA